MGKYSTKVLYFSGSQCGDQYARGNSNPYGTKWKVYTQTDGMGILSIVGKPHLLEANWSVDIDKIEDTMWWVDTQLY